MVAASGCPARHRETPHMFFRWGLNSFSLQWQKQSQPGNRDTIYIRIMSTESNMIQFDFVTYVNSSLVLVGLINPRTDSNMFYQCQLFIYFIIFIYLFFNI
ncbi:hypothetical protein ILYODFUR_000310 [Ilyodon furcidens]|uniref:Uncharacterized protein n=1 Tax=Ilyodon furcidens TaxID=33524 RepID=A0ABV0ST12_9TELE